MRRVVAFDTNMLLRWILQDIPDQSEQVVRLLKHPDIKEIQVADMALAEVIWVLGAPRIGFSRAEIITVLNIVLKHPKLNYNQALISRALPLYQLHPAVSFIDICLSIYAELYSQATLLTFDKKLAKTLTHAMLADTAP